MVNINGQNGQSVSIFLASSFVLPIDYQLVHKKIIALKVDLDVIRARIEIHKQIAEQVENIKKITEYTQTNDRRSIEILRIFAAIVLFTSGSIQIFSIEGTTWRNALLWMIMFAYSLTFFVISIWLVTRSKEDLEHVSNTYWFSYIAFVLIWFSSFYYLIATY